MLAAAGMFAQEQPVPPVASDGSQVEAEASPLEKDHRSAASWAGPERSRLAWWIRVGWHRMRRGGDTVGKQLSAKRNQRTTAAAGQKAEVPDADEATRQDMPQEAA